MKRAIHIAAAVAVIAAVYVFALPQFADFSRVWTAVRQMTWVEVTTLVAVAAWNLVTYWIAEAAALPGTNLWQTMKVTQTATAVANTMPGGGALGVGVTYSMYSAYGFSRPEVALSIVASGLWNNFVKLAMPIVALSLLALSGGATSGRVAAAAFGFAFLLVVVAVIALTLRSDRFARAVGRVIGRAVSFVRRRSERREETWSDRVASYRVSAIKLLRKRGLALTVATLLSHFSLFVVLVLCLRHIGVSASEVGWIEALAVFSFVRLLTALPITPGGLGIVELALSGGLIAAGGPKAQVVAAVLVYRALTYLVPIVLGLLAYAQWRRHSEDRRIRAEQRRAAAALAEKSI